MLFFENGKQLNSLKVGSQLLDKLVSYLSSLLPSAAILAAFGFRIQKQNTKLVQMREVVVLLLYDINKNEPHKLSF